MNIKITYNWLLEYLETDADPYELQKYLSLAGPSIERVDKIGDDYVFNIEITSNRIDMASVLGVAQEAQAILPMFGKKAKLKVNPLQKYTFENLNTEPNHQHQLEVKIENHDLVPRFTAMVFSNIQIKPSPDFIKNRLEMCDIKSINNVVDISNYLMLALGQPVHMFDYDKIAGHNMIVRESKKGEKLKTLDDKEIILPGGDIVIEDGEGRLIDLCGIMGGANSAISLDTQNIVFFVQTYDKRKIRKTSMTTGQRTVAATYFEKGLDTERVEPTFVYGVDLINELTDGSASSPLYDIYPHHYKHKEVVTYLSNIQRLMGVPIEQKQVVSILENLGFKVHTTEQEGFSYPDNIKFTVTVPSFRAADIEIKEDITEEVARVYGYQNLPSEIQPSVYIKQPREIELLFTVQQKVKYFLKHLGLHEVMNYSMISKELIDTLDLKEDNKLKLANTISEEIKYLRTTLTASLIKNIKDNEGKKDILKFFEIAKVYEKREKDLPHEQYRFAIAVNTSFADLKGIIEALLKELNILRMETLQWESEHYSPHISAEIRLDGRPVIRFGQLKKSYQDRMKIKNTVYLAEFEFTLLAEHYKNINTYISPQQYSVVKLDLTVKHTKDLTFAKIKEIAARTSLLVSNIEVKDTFHDNLTLRFYFASPDRNITEEVAKAALETIKSKLK